MADVQVQDPSKAPEIHDEVLAEKTAALNVYEPQNEATPQQSTLLEKAEEVPEKTEVVILNDGPVKEPFPHPLPSCKPEPQSELTEEQSIKYSSLLEQVKSFEEIPTKSGANASANPINDQDRLFLTRECLLRYLRASKWDVATAKKRLMATLTWRREYGLLDHTHDYISPENETGKQVILGYDNDARPCLYLNPARQNTERTERQLQHLFYMMERVIDIMGPGQESLALLVNFMDTRRGQGASIGQAKETMSVLQNHYPERLGRALITECRSSGACSAREYN
jgi:hypothetical protein